SQRMVSANVISSALVMGLLRFPEIVSRRPTTDYWHRADCCRTAPSPVADSLQLRSALLIGLAPKSEQVRCRSAHDIEGFGVGARISWRERRIKVGSVRCRTLNSLRK